MSWVVSQVSPLYCGFYLMVLREYNAHLQVFLKFSLHAWLTLVYLTDISEVQILHYAWFRKRWAKFWYSVRPVQELVQNGQAFCTVTGKVFPCKAPTLSILSHKRFTYLPMVRGSSDIITVIIINFCLFQEV